MTNFARANELLRLEKYEEAATVYRGLIAEKPRFAPYSFNAELAESKKNGKSVHSYDILIATDLTFPGGSSSSTLEEILVNSANGLKTGLYHIPSPVMKRKRKFHTGLMQAVREGKCYLIGPTEARLKADLLLFRHPSVLHVTTRHLPRVDAAHVAVVVNHPPSNATGRIDYVLTQAFLRAKTVYGVVPKIFPIGPLIRTRIREFYADTVPLQPEDWINVFDIGRFATSARTSPRRPLRIGRHSRSAREKWPSDPQGVLGAYPDSPNVDVRILGGSEVPERILGYRPQNWTVYKFGELEPERFLDEIDVFVYFHHPDWVEAFGRVIVEAMAAGLPLVLPKHFEPLIGDAAIYCDVAEVKDAIGYLSHEANYAEFANRSKTMAIERFGHDAHLRRLRPLVQRSITV